MSSVAGKSPGERIPAQGEKKEEKVVTRGKRKQGKKRE